MRFLLFFIFIMTSLFTEAVFYASDELRTIYPVPGLTVIVFLIWGLLWSVVTSIFASRLRRALLPGRRLWYPLLVTSFLMAPQCINALVPGLGLPPLPVPKTSSPLNPYLFYLLLSVCFLAALAFVEHPKRVQRSATRSGVFLLFIVVLGLWIENIPPATQIEITPENPDVSGSSELPNIFLFVLDTMRRDVLDPYSTRGSFHPAVSQIASEGMILEDVWAPVPYTSGSHASMMFGLYPPRHQVGLQKTDLPNDLQSLPRLLGRKGYVTGAVSANPHVSRFFGYENHFDFVGDPENDLDVLPRRLKSVLFNNKLMWSMYRATMAIGINEWLSSAFNIRQTKVDATSVVEMIRRFVETNSEHPIFLLGNFMETHWPYISTREERRKLFQGSGTSWDELRHKYTRIVVHGRRTRKESNEQFTIRDKELLEALYMSEARYLDNQIRQLMSSLEEMGALDRALVFFVSDHGELFGEEGLYGHSCSLNERLLHVPAVLWWSDGILDESLRGRKFWPRISLVDIPHAIADMVYGYDPFPSDDVDTVMFSGHSFWKELPQPVFWYGDSLQSSRSALTPLEIPYRRQWSGMADTVLSPNSRLVFGSLSGRVRVLFDNRMAEFADGTFIKGWRSTKQGWTIDSLPPPTEIARQVAVYTKMAVGNGIEKESEEKPEFLKEHLKALGYIE